MKEITEIITHPENIEISQTVAILIDGNNIERSIHSEADNTNTMLNLDALVPKLLVNRGLSRLVYFREGKHISEKLQERLHNFYHGSVRPCHKSADIPLSINAIQLANKVDTIIIMSGDSDYIELVRHLKSEGVRVEIAAVLKTTSQLLKDEADYYHEITKEDWFTLAPKKTQAKKTQARKTQARKTQARKTQARKTQGRSQKSK
ncbi:MAG: NYN domain-containing protein [Proteobacteria bacterium]|nr:NYN domain-containing protein [Pseudomonadota bacterium]